MVSIVAERPITLIEACKLFPNKPHKNTVKRWMFTGVRGVKLRNFKCGQSICTTERAIDDFLLATNPDYQASAQSVDCTGHAAAEEKLAAMGV